MENCYRNALQLAKNNQLKTIAFPNISTGVYGFPKKMAAEIAIGSVHSFLEMPGTVEKIIFVVFGKDRNLLVQ